MTAPVLFLDIDGVLCLADDLFDPRCLTQLRRVVAVTGADLVLSSCWRHYPTWPTLLRRRGLNLPIIGVTPRLNGMWHGWRGSEITAWLAENPNPRRRYAIVDDDDDMDPEQRPYFVRTDPRFGLTRRRADRLIRILRGAP